MAFQRYDMNNGNVFLCVHLQKHDEFHQMFSATKHKTMSIQEHLDSQRYQPSEKCTTHTEKPVKMACTECCQFFCDDCNLQSNCNPIGKLFSHVTPHNLSCCFYLYIYIPHIFDNSKVPSVRILLLLRFNIHTY
mgnify:CR=1 FL=1